MKIVFCTLHVRRSPQAVALAAGCLAAALPVDLRQGSVLIDAFLEQTDEEIIDAILAVKPEVVAFPVYVWNRQRVIRLARQLRQQNADLLLIAGGPEATGDPEGLSAAVKWTALVHGEGEAALAGLIAALQKGKLDLPLAGVTLFLEEGTLSGAEHCHYDLDTALSPWLAGMIRPEPAGGVLWEVARGCAFSCDYCFEARGHAGVRHIPQERLEEELALFTAAGVSQVWVLDSTFNYPPERGITLLELLLEKAPQLHYHLEAKPDFIDRKTARLLGELNCSVQLGLQSIHEQVLKTIHRPLELELLAEKVHLLNAEGVIYGFDLIYGLPEDSYAGFKASLDTVLSFSPNHIHTFPLAILPGTKLARRRERYGIKAQKEPPYELISSTNWSVSELELCRRLAAALDVFYNTGRAVAFFPAILQTLQTQPSALFENFFAWAVEQDGVSYDSLLKGSSWGAEEIFRMLQRYLSSQLKKTGQEHLISVFLDFLCYHFNYAETLLGEELLLPPEASWSNTDLWETRWLRTKNYRLVPFAYEIMDLLEMEDVQMQEIISLFRPVGSVALFMKRDGEVYCESLSEEMLQLLKESNGSLSPKEIFAGSLAREIGEELIEFALSEGLLEPLHKSSAAA